LSIRDLRYVLRSIWQSESNHGQRVRRTIFFFGWQFWKRVVGSPVKARLFNGLQIEVWPDCNVSPSALYYSVPNDQAISFLRSHLKGGTFIDVGANIGLVSLLVADKIEHAILYEPNPLAVARARKNLAMNGLPFEVVAEALSDAAGTVQFENGGGTNACNRTVDGFITSQPTITVPRTTLDQFLQDHPPKAPVKAVKIDVEGHENSVLRGMKGFLRTARPKLVMFEYLQRTDISQVLATFGEVEYSVFELTASGPRIATAQVRPLQDLFACPNELALKFGI
jgi:FkbM family methyltransferase